MFVGLSLAKNGPCGDGRTPISLQRPFRTGKNCGGDSETELAECYPGAGGEVAGCLGDVFNAGETHDAHGEFTQCRHHAGSVLGSDLGQVLMEGGVADMMVTVFNSPMATSEIHNVRVNSSGCLGRCKDGPVLVIYPDGIWYTFGVEDDVREIIQEHIMRGHIVKRLRLNGQ